MTEPPESALDDRSWADLERRLGAFAHRRLDGTRPDGRDAEDFAHEALGRYLAGSRRLPPGVALFPFLTRVVESLISHARRRPTGVERSGDAGDPEAATDVDPRELLEQTERLRALWRRLRSAIAGDADASHLLDALIDRWPARTITDLARDLGWEPERALATWRRIKRTARAEGDPS